LQLKQKFQNAKSFKAGDLVKFYHDHASYYGIIVKASYSFDKNSFMYKYIYQILANNEKVFYKKGEAIKEAL
jgi:hypothetical protein